MSPSLPPPPLRVLISGAGIAGPALALHLTRLPPPLKCVITVVERHPTLRNNGQQIDLRGQGVDSMRKLHMEPAVRALIVHEPGLRLLDRRGRLQAYLAGNKSGKGAQSFSAEWEIMRGDLCQLLHDATKDLEGVRYEFGKAVERIEQDGEGKAPATVTFSDGTVGEYDLVVGCDGLSSRVRRRMFTDGRPDGVVPVGMWTSYYTIPPEEGDTDDATWCHYPGGRFVMTRRDRPDCRRVYLAYSGKDESILRRLKHGTLAEQKEAWADVFRPDQMDAHGIKRYLDGLHSAHAEDFYSVEFAQVKLDSWSSGRATLVGDAGYCPAPLTGMGTSLALAGAYVLAGEIARGCGKVREEGQNPWDAIPAALAAYEKTLRPFVTDVQNVPTKRIVSILTPQSNWAISLLRWILWFVTATKIDQLAGRFGSDDRGGWQLPDYPELVVPKEEE
ncbi:hypothetical protein C8A05DRAFT_44176 [Staphylotrichum tortipilum]|uniref:FAD-binding domain-containing protein n=1 Tax=Staphylotrichum tortipilum TaxID=2831512 RepID=A0AAN6MLF0_9PEZI|nr:hypothetical protein C8A05DRAFT_44176 [Staphylotrichum longicolle]